MRLNPGKVIDSISSDNRCVDIFERSDGTFGFNDFRKDPEDREAWTLTANYSDLAFRTKAEAVASAKVALIWFTRANIR